ncbi:MAG: tetratricopeptide repeat protein [Longimicrobiales bacterium]
MSTSNVVSLDELRGHREMRLRLTLAMHRVEEDRRLVAERLHDVLQVTGADRAALVWIDEYGPGLVHTHCVLDLLSDRPRRSFAVEPLQRAWERGIPGLLDEPDLVSSGRAILVEAPRSLASVALGSDGLRAWFLVVDSRTPRSSFDSATADELMFLAGECASIVIHEDLEPSEKGRRRTIGGRETGGPPLAPSSFERERRSRFPGWPVLQDVDDGTDDPGRDRAVTFRFLVARLLRELVDDDFAVDSGFFQERVDAVRDEIRENSGSERPSAQWKEVLDSLEGEDYGSIAASVLSLAVDAENEGHLHGARELNRLAYDLAVAGCHGKQAVDAARFLGRVNRRLGSWDESQRWYDAAGTVAEAAGLKRGQALAMDGLANTYRVRGNLPGARDAYLEVLEMGVAIEDADLRGRAHQNLALVEKHAGRTDEALKHGWEAVRSFLGTNEFYFYRALADLGDIFLRCGELASAEHAFEVVAAGIDNLDVRVIALDALGHIAALRGDRTGFERRLERLDREPLEDVGVEVSAEMMLHRGESWIVLGEQDEGQRWLRRSLEFAEKHGVNRILFDAEEKLRELEGNRHSEMLEHQLPRPSSETMSALEIPLQALTPAASGP